MSTAPQEAGFDHSLAFLADPYRYISSRCRGLGSDLFETRILLQPAICMSGPEAAAVFYDPERFQRAGAAPEPLQATLFGKGGVQGLDGAAHRERKALFMKVVEPERVAALAGFVASEWWSAARRWQDEDRVILYQEVVQLLTRAVCTWAYVPLAEGEADKRSRQMARLFDEAANSGAGHLRSRYARRRLEKWLARLVGDIRDGRYAVPRGCAAEAVATHVDADAQLLPAETAAVELLNVLRPTVAVAVFIVFAAHALHAHPECRERLGGDDPDYEDAFVQEVRRYYPFFPAVAARVRADFDWAGMHFPEGRLVLLDLYGSNRDPRVWEAPDAFRPERFLEHSPGAFDFMPQGGAEPYGNHRCPGEGIAVTLMRQAVGFLVRHLDYQVPMQDLRLDFSRLPALPCDGFILSEVRLRQAEARSRPQARSWPGANV